MKNTRKKFLEEMLEALKSQKEELVKSFMNYDANIDVGSDETDYIQATILSTASSSLINHNKSKLQKIEVAIKKISDGTFGVCEECGEEIAEKRLMFNPWFNNCIGCAEEKEIIKKQYGR